MTLLPVVDELRVAFNIPGVPRPQGSKRHVGRGIMIETNANLRPWRSAVTWAAQQAMGERPAFAGAVHLHLRFNFPRPASHYLSSGQLRGGAPAYPGAKAGDLDKLCRAAIDAMTEGGCWLNDTQVCDLRALKVYDAQAGLSVVLIP